MNNHLSIAAVTQAIQHLLQTEVGRDHTGVKITSGRPTTADNSIAGPSINTFLYQFSLNEAFRNADVHTRRPKGSLTKRGQIGFDLYYLFSFYGNELDLEPQALAGLTMRTFVDHPILSQDYIERSLAETQNPRLKGLTFSHFREVILHPQDLSNDQMSRIWSMFGQTPYALSLVYSAVAILIEGKQVGQLGLPVRRRAAHVAFSRPFLTEIEHFPLKHPRERLNTITLESRIVLHGRDLNGQDEDKTRIQIGKHIQLVPQVRTPEQVELNLARLDPAVQENLRAGNQGIQVVRLSEVQGEQFTVASNSLPFILCPQILTVEGQPDDPQAAAEEGTPFTGRIVVELDLWVEPGQQVYLLLNGHSSGNDREYILTATRLTEASPMVAFAVEELTVGAYLLRVQVDGAVSPLLVNRAQEYAGPMFTIV
ncbi:MAG: DUF4255 domain-containing protein [Cyanobacteria bacterium P01_G01_bin.54]